MSLSSPTLFEKLLVLSGESTVDVYLLADDKELIAKLRSGLSQDEALEYINENY